MAGHSQLHRTRDGRVLGYAEYGDLSGLPLLYFHGWPGSRLEAQMLASIGAELGARVVAIDRPGMGLAGFQPGRTLLDWPGDVLDLADALGLGRFIIVGMSGGGPYAAVCAALIPERLFKVALVCALGPLDVPNATRSMVWHNRLLLRLGRHFPQAVKPVLAMVARGLKKHPDRIFGPNFTRALPETDQRALADPVLHRALWESIREAFRHGVEGPWHDGQLYLRPWGFRCQDIQASVFIAHGERDVHVPVSHGRWLAQSIPRCQAVFYPEESHLSLPLNRARDIFKQLLTNP